VLARRAERGAWTGECAHGAGPAAAAAAAAAAEVDAA